MIKTSNFDSKEHWNKSHLAHPKDRKASNYAVDKEKNSPRNSMICDLGGGDGTDSLYFIEKGHEVYLFDVANLALKRAEEKAKEASQSMGIKDLFEPFFALFGAIAEEKKKETKKSGPVKDIVVEQDTWLEKTHLRPLTAADAETRVFALFDVYKKAHQMPSYP